MRALYYLTGVLAAISLANHALAQEQVEEPAAETDDEAVLDRVLVVSDRIGLLEQSSSESVFGMGKSLLETPRSATLVSDLTLERYGIEEVDDLIAIAPGTFTSSYYGVKGAVNARGTLAETYFNGFKRVENRGTYPTLLGAASQVDIVRGPPTPVFGPGKVGGAINIIPKTARATGRQFIEDVTGEAEVTVGSYGKFNANGQIGVPVTDRGGLYAYVEVEDSDSFYRGVSAEHVMLQLSGEFDVTDTLSVTMSGQYFDSDGYVQSPGWNRVTQELIDNQTYITGRNTVIVDTDGNGRITPDEAGGSFVVGYFGFTPPVDPRFQLTEGVGTAKLDPRTIFISDADFSETTTNTLYFEAEQAIGDNSLSFEVFYDDLENQRFVSYGFPADYDAWAAEARLSYDFDIGSEDSFFRATNKVGIGHRQQDAVKKESFNAGYISLDRRDIIFGATPNDIIDDPFSNEPNTTGVGWDIVVDSSWKDTGVFALSDMAFGDYVNLLLGARFDSYEVSTIDTGALCYCPSNTQFDDDDTAFSYNASLSFNTPVGLFPYVTYAESAALEIGQAGDIAPALVQSDQWISDSELLEAGVKFELLEGTLVGSLAGYEQERTRVGINNSVVGTTSEGVELEVRWLATDNVSFTFAGNTQKTTTKGPDGSFAYIPVWATGLDPVDGYGAAYAVYNLADSGLGPTGDYEYRLVPQTVFSVFGSYVSDEKDWGQFGLTAGLTSVSETAGKLTEAIILPAYETVNLSAFYTVNGYELALNVDNVFDELYFQPVTDTYSDMAVLPGRGTEYRVSLKKRF
ncbi:TonB-dependent receptor [Henriciella sp. AS95]|uniref:TonB-dependent siderophore receptor n=1 Tax=Henriciella sp. AS95 TaxID=3135782 RepID=UPI00317B6EDC